MLGARVTEPRVCTLCEGLLIQPIRTFLCTGYTACKQAGYSDAGYSANNDTMYWRMYAGHNCTNYVAG